MRPATGSRCCARASRCATGGSSSRAEGRIASRRSSHARSRRRLARVAGTEERVAADTLCLGYGFVPSVELLRLAGCAIGDDEDRGGPVARSTSGCARRVAGVLRRRRRHRRRGLASSPSTRVASRRSAPPLELGAIDEADASARRRRCDAASRAAARSAGTRPHARGGPGNHELASADTVVCRCEEVTRAALEEAVDATADLDVVKASPAPGWGSARAATAGGQVAALIASRTAERSPDGAATPRLPPRPVPLAAIADDSIEDHGFFTAAADARPRAALACAPSAAGPIPRTPTCSSSAAGWSASRSPYYLARGGRGRRALERGELNREASGTNAGCFHLQIAIHQLTGVEDAPARPSGCCGDRLYVEAAELWQGLETSSRSTRDARHRRADGRRDRGAASAAARQAADRGGRRAWRRTCSRAPRCALRPLSRGGVDRCDVLPRRGAREPADRGAVERFARPVGRRDRTHAEVTRSRGGREVSSSRRRGVDPRAARRQRGGCLGGTRRSRTLPMRREGLHVNVTEPRARCSSRWSSTSAAGSRSSSRQRDVHHRRRLAGALAAGAGALRDRWESAAGQRGGRACGRARARGRARRAHLVGRDGVHRRPLADRRRVGAAPGILHDASATTGFTLGPLMARMLAEQMARLAAPRRSPTRPRSHTGASAGGHLTGGHMDRNDVSWRGYWAACPTPYGETGELDARPPARAARLLRRTGSPRRPDQRHDRRVVLAVDRGAPPGRGDRDRAVGGPHDRRRRLHRPTRRREVAELASTRSPPGRTASTSTPPPYCKPFPDEIVAFFAGHLRRAAGRAADGLQLAPRHERRDRPALASRIAEIEASSRKGLDAELRAVRRDDAGASSTACACSGRT